MATKKFLIEEEEGVGKCSDCPFLYCKYICKYGEGGGVIVDCDKYNLATMKITEMEEEK